MKEATVFRTKLKAEGRVLIPKSIRDDFDLKYLDEIELEIRGIYKPFESD